MNSTHGSRAQVVLVGSGKLAREIAAALPALLENGLVPWEERQQLPSLVVHCGSGRQLPEVLAFCKGTGSALLELSTGTELPPAPGFPLVECPNANILMVKFMAMLASCGHLLKGYPLRLTESHQAGKVTRAGTAVRLAETLGLDAGQIRSVRDPEVQQRDLGIPPHALERHAYHLIEIGDGACSIRMETRVENPQPYVQGVASILRALGARCLEGRRYTVEELVQLGWI